MLMMRSLMSWSLVAITVMGCAPAVKDLKPTLAATDSGTIWFASAGTLVRSTEESRFVPGPPVVLSGELRVPSGRGPFPAVVLAHGCSGTGAHDREWARILHEWGYATLVVDSFSGRGLKEVCTSAGTLTGTQRIPDAYGALRILATRPRIDAGRVALMGFSHGGSRPSAHSSPSTRTATPSTPSASASPPRSVFTRASSMTGRHPLRAPSS